MKSLRLYLAFCCLAVLWSACKDAVVPDEPVPFLKAIIESRYTPDDSLTITYKFDQTHKLTREEYTSRYAPPVIIDLYKPTDFPAPSNTSVQYRLHSYNAQNQEISVRKYFSQYGTHWSVFDSDSLIYNANQVVRQEHKDYYFIVDGMGVAFNYPLWLTKRKVDYDGQQRIISETDSVFMTHDMPAGDVVLAKAPAKYLHTNKTTYEYNEKGDVSKTIAITSDEQKVLKYANGWDVLNTEGKGYAASVRMRFSPGTTTYAYEYNATGNVIRKIATYNDRKSAQNYISTFTYAYE